jgi:hypothetical protein
MTTAIITGNLTDSGVVLTTTAANVTISNSTTITISSEYSELEFDFSESSKPIGTIHEIQIKKVIPAVPPSTNPTYLLLGTVCSPNYKCTTPVVTEVIDFHYAEKSTPNSLLGDPSDSTGEIIVTLN